MRQVGVDGAGQGQRFVDVFENDADRGVGLKGQAAGDQLIKHDAERIDVGAGVARLPQALLGSHIRRGAHQRAGCGVFDAGYQLGNAEVGEDDAARAIQHDVGRFDVAVDHIALVGVGERRADILNDADGLGQRQALALRGVFFQSILERAAVNKLHHHVIRRAVVIEVVDLNDVGVAQCADVLGLAREAAEEVRVFGQERVHEFDGHVAVEAGLIGFVYFGHAAAP